MSTKKKKTKKEPRQKGRESGWGGYLGNEKGPTVSYYFGFCMRFVFQSIMLARVVLVGVCNEKGVPMIVLSAEKGERGREREQEGHVEDMFRGYLSEISFNVLLLPRAGRAPEPLPINLSPR